MDLTADFVLIQTASQLRNYFSDLTDAKIIGIDTETTGLNPHADKLRLLQLALPNTPVLVIDCFTVLPEGLSMIRQIFSHSCIKIFHNAKFDLQFLNAASIEVSLPIFDTMLAASLLRSCLDAPARLSLAELCRHYLGISLCKEEQQSDFSADLSDDQLAYAAKDAFVLLSLRQVLIDHLKQHRLIEVARQEFSCVRAVAQMEYQGIYLDLERWTQLTEQTQQAYIQAKHRLEKFSDTSVVQLSLFGEEQIVYTQNFNSNKQMLNLLRQLGIELPDTSHHSLLSHSDHPFVQAFLEYRRSQKLLSAFLLPIPQLIDSHTGRLHPHYGQNGAWSGRMSCGGPNIQQIPREDAFRACFRAPPHRKLILADYSQIELRVAAEMAQDQRMIEAYQNGEDLHRLTASLISGKSMDQITKQERQAAKAVNFGLIYAMGAKGLQAYAQDTYSVAMTLEEATAFRTRFFKAYRGIAAWHADLQKHPPEYTRTVAGRKHVFRSVPGLSGCTNTPVQGGAADIVKHALGLLMDMLKGTDTYPVCMVHDEIILETPENKAQETATLLNRCMVQAGRDYLKQVPVIAEVQIADSWCEK